MDVLALSEVSALYALALHLPSLVPVWMFVTIQSLSAPEASAMHAVNSVPDLQI
jgi:hypothetical protein